MSMTEGTSYSDFLSELDTGGGDSGIDDSFSPEVDAPVAGESDGQAEAEGTPSTTDFDITQYADTPVRVKVNGEEVEVPLKEALAGYQRQADYTRKSQELANARALQEALQNNPQATLKILAEAYGIGTQTAEAASEPTTPEWAENDPVAQRLLDLERQAQERFAVIEQFEMERQTDAVLAGLTTKYGDAFTSVQQEVLNEAIARNIEHPTELESVFRDLMFERMFAQQSAQQTLAEKSAADDASRRQAKEALAGTVETGGGVRGASAAPPSPTIRTIEDAWAVAKQQLGL